MFELHMDENLFLILFEKRTSGPPQVCAWNILHTVDYMVIDIFHVDRIGDAIAINIGAY